MIDEYAMYSEEEYVNKIHLLNIYNGTICECIWEEVIAYRKRYEYGLNIDERKYYITLNKTLFYKMNRLYECEIDFYPQQLNLYNFIHQNISDKEKLLLYIKENNVLLNNKIFRFLLSEEMLLLKIFFIGNILKDEDLLSFYLILKNKEGWYPFLKKISIPSFENVDSLDITYAYRFFLDDFYFHLSNKVIPLNSGNFCDEYPLEELILLFPMLSVKKITFYYHHNQKNHYYTIKNYMDYFKISYEAARQAMQQLCVMGWYQKVKIGKKHVYMPSK